MEVTKDTAQAVGDAIRARRTELGLTQEEVGERASIHPTYIGTIERGEKNVSLARFVEICRALESRPSDLMRGVGL